MLCVFLIFLRLLTLFHMVLYWTNSCISFDVNPYIVKWVHSYLFNRTQHVVVNGCDFAVLPVISGVPQGFVLGPYLFLVYINAIVDVISEDSKIVMFADDIALYRAIRSPLDFFLLQLDVDAICNWISLNYLTLNIRKCCYMIFTRKRFTTLPTTPLMVNNLALAKVDSFKYLGVNLSANLSWSEHVNCIAMKTRRLVGLLYRRFYCYLDSHVMVKLYITFIRPHLEYACTVWSSYLQKDIQALENVQKFAFRVCTGQWSMDYETLLSFLNTSSLATRRCRLKLRLLYNIVNNNVDFPFNPMIYRQHYYPHRHVNTSALVVPHACSTQFQQSFFPSIIRLWNSLSDDIMNSSSITYFNCAISSLNFDE